MNNIKKLIKEVIEEIFDNPELPKDLKFNNTGEKISYNFSTKNHNYCVLFDKKDGSKFGIIGLTKDININKIIQANNSVFYLNWGLCSDDGIPYDNTETKKYEEIYVFNSVFSIVKKFIDEHKPEIIFYKSLGKRKRIYDFILKKMSLNFTKVDSIDNSFLIRGDLIHSENPQP